ncbi:A-type Fe-S protein [Wigglesworthia glossinidia endosymbiont of Glossina morsitans morsitans (Yale colony)]|uniref:A-type Fe-S protein n=1 Tax=Wigglesworthia glossinidia endosymbiont of Glossina morsitans morsitans (Yale colony) TaxID=1142511 RepID=H6Q5N4_WIGGL|nr:iron-sulfur cluster insertion protein ErpA [Wigglesworthia glossinidia]AFA40938.1 A-type Fe-S protein [Wigglesworthia glossinidia endosymbiont of Glossina morsitans morsitans (Yale colony)]
MNTKNLLNLKLTDLAIKKIQELLQCQLNKKFRIYISGGGCNGFQYNFMIDDKISEEDSIISFSKIDVVVDFISLQYLIGGTIDYKEELLESCFFVINPNAKTTCSCGISFSI